MSTIHMRTLVAQSDQDLRCPLIESFDNLECIGVYVYEIKKPLSLLVSKQTHNVATTSLQRRCNVTTLQRRCNDVVRTLYVYWYMLTVKMTKEHNMLRGHHFHTELVKYWSKQSVTT